MKRKIKVTLFVLFGLFFNYFGQNIEVTHQANGTVLSVPVQSIDSVIFQSVPPPALKNIYQSNGNVLSIATDDVDSITYIIPDTTLLPQVSTGAATVLSSSSAYIDGTVIDEGDSPVTERGFCWSLSSNPTIANNTSLNGNGLGSFNHTVQPLSPSTIYYVRAYASNGTGTAYGNQVTFTTSSPNTSGSVPVVETDLVDYNDGLTALSGGNITADGGLAVTARGVCWAVGTTPTVNSSITIDGIGAGTYTSTLSNLLPNTSYFVRAYATNDAGTAYGISYAFTTNGLPVVSTINIDNITMFSANVNSDLTSDGGSTIIERGVCWSVNPSPTIMDNSTNIGVAIGNYSIDFSGLSYSTFFYARSYAINNVGIAYGNSITFTTLPFGPIYCNSAATAIVDVTNPTTGEIWMDRNLGATQVATSSTDVDSYGDLYQWGRFSDGHQCRTSATNPTLSSVDQPAHGDFIIGAYDWRSPQNDNLWQGVNGINNPCPSGYRIPTEAELEAERLSWSANNSTGALASPLKLPMAGNRYSINGSLSNAGAYGGYWSSTVSGANSRGLGFFSIVAGMDGGSRADGVSVRCIKD